MVPKKILFLLMSFAFISCSAPKAAKKQPPEPEKPACKVCFHLEAQEQTEKEVFTVKLREKEETFQVRKEPVLTEKDLESVKLISGLVKRYDILLQFNPRGAEKLKQITRENRNKRMAVLVDGKTVMTPLIYQAIPGGVVVITSIWDEEQTKAIYEAIRAGIR
jgi:preprotein translocase subunit SecD